MPLFNFRRAGSSSAPSSASSAASAAPESVEAVRKRAKHRLIGASVLVLAGVLGFPVLFDTQPRPVAMDIPIEIPGKNSVKPLTLPSPSQPSQPVATAPPVKPQNKVADASSLQSKEEIISDKRPAASVPPAPSAPKKEVKSAPQSDTKPQTAEATPKPAAPADDGARARALLNGQSAAGAAPQPAPAAKEGRIVVQVGAFADAAKAREARQKLESAGLKTYTQVAETDSGKRIRVRVGPFGSRAEAEKAASKIKSLDLPAAILTL